jgi:hypothetical protein
MKNHVLTFFVCILCSLLSVAQVRLVTVDPATDQIILKNFGTSAVDISNYRLCALLEYATLNQPSVTLVSGDFDLASGEMVTIAWTSVTGFGAIASDVGLYLPSGNFSSPAAMVDFMEYGAGMQGRENVAVSAGYWVANTFISTSGPYYFTGGATDYGFQFWSNQMPVDVAEVVINEVDANQTGLDAAEFIELYGAPNASLDGLVVVFVNGNLNNGVDNASYAAYDLDGFSTDANGFFVLGNAGVNGVQLEFPGNSLQNGADVVAVYAGDAADWPLGTAAVVDNLVDALVYDAQTTTPNPVDQVLLDLLTPGQIQLDENAFGTGITVSMSRVPDGGAAFNTAVYALQVPTPGATNALQVPCAAGSTTVIAGDAELCLGGDNPSVDFAMQGGTPGDNTWYVITDVAGVIIGVSEVSVIDLDAILTAQGSYRVWAFTFSGTLNVTTLAPGLPASGISSDDCLSLSSAAVNINVVDCSVAVCDGGTVAANGAANWSFCADASADNMALTNTGTSTNTGYVYVLTDASNNIVQLLLGDQLDANTLALGEYRIWGLSYEGNLDPFSTSPGFSATEIVSDGECIELSENFIALSIVECAQGEPCAELFFSEYIEGSSNTKALEIFNPTNFFVDLSTYSVSLYSNGSVDPTGAIALSGELAPFDVYVIVNPQAAPELLSLADTTSGILNFNGDDAVSLINGSEIIDVIGVIGTDPGNAWPVSSGSTQDRTLVRQAVVNAGTTSWSLSASQWDVYPQNDFTFLGGHTFVPCDPTPLIGFTVSGQIVQEGDGAASIDIQAYNIGQSVTLEVNFLDGSSVMGEDFTDVFPIALTFPPGTSVQTIEIPIIDDDIEEDDPEYFTVQLTTATSVNYTFQNHTVTIAASDQNYPLYSIAPIKTTDEFGIMDSIGVFCEIRGTVHKINFNAQGTHFTVIDATDGIKVFKALNNLGYMVQEGDFVHVGGRVSQFMGQAEIDPDYIQLISSNNPLTPALAVSGPLNEGMESHVVRISCVRLVDPSQWQTGPGGFYVNVTDGTTVYSVRIDEDAAFFGVPAFPGSFTLEGIVEQVDMLDPFDEGYSLWPAIVSDIQNTVEAAFNTFDTFIYNDSGASVSFTNTSEGAVNYLWDFGDGTTSTDANPVHVYGFAWLNANPVFNISLTATGVDGCTNELIIEVVPVFSLVEEANRPQLSVYPNPAGSVLNVLSNRAMDELYMMDGFGRRVHMERINGTRCTLDVQALAAGIYHLVILADGQPQSTTFIKH